MSTPTSNYAAQMVLKDIRAHMKAMNITQADMARELKVSRQYVSRIFRPESAPNITLGSLFELADAIHMHIQVRIFTP